jgi:hypothetical protein
VTEPAQHLGDGFDPFPHRHKWPADHHHRQCEVARGLDFGRGRLAPGVPGHDDVGAVVRQHGAVAGAVERPARHDDLGARQRQRRPRRIDQPNQISVLRMRCEGFEMHPADAEKHPTRRRAERFGRSLEIVDLDPAVAMPALPRRAVERQQRHAGHGAGGNGVGADLRRERMGGVDDARNLFGAKIVCEAIDAAEAPRPPGNRRRRRVFGAAGIRQYRVDARILRHHLREPVGVGGAAEDQNAQASGWRGCHDCER